MAGNDLVLKISADTKDVATGLAPMSNALDSLQKSADDTSGSLSKLEGVTVSPDVNTDGLAQLSDSASAAQTSLDDIGKATVAPNVDTTGLDSASASVAQVKSGIEDASATPLNVDVRQQALDAAELRIETLKDTIAEQVVMGVDTRPAQRELAGLERSVKDLTDEPQNVELNITEGGDGVDFELEKITKLRKSAKALTTVFLEAGSGINTLPSALNAANGAMIVLNASFSEYIAKREALSLTTGGFVGGLGRVSAFLAGGWGLAIGAGITLLSSFITGQKKATTATDDWTKSLNEQAGALDENNRRVVATELQKQGLLDLAEQAGVSTSDMVTAFLQGGSALDTFLAKIQSSGTIIKNDGTWGVQGTLAQDTTKPLRDGLLNMANQADSTAGKTHQIATAVEGLGVSTKSTTTAIDDQATVMSVHQQIWDDYASSIKTAETELNKLLDGINLYNGLFANAQTATVDYNQTLDDLNKTLRENGKQTKDHGKTINADTEAGRANITGLIKMAKSVDTLRDARLRDAKDTGESTAQIMGDYEKQRQALVRSAMQAGLTQKAAQDYVDTLLHAPTDIETKIALENYEKTKNQINDLTKDQTVSVTLQLNAEKFMNDIRRHTATARAELGGSGIPGYNSAPVPSLTPTPYGASTVFLQPRIFLDSQPIGAMLHADVVSTVGTTVAATRTRGRL